MTKIGKQAPYLDGVTQVASTTERDALFASPDTGQRVQFPTGLVQRWDGTRWATASHGAKGGPTFDVSAYGATGLAADDVTPAVTAAMVDLAVAGGGTLLFPNGIHNFQTVSTISAISNLTIRAEPGAELRCSVPDALTITTNTTSVRLALEDLKFTNYHLTAKRACVKITVTGAGAWENVVLRRVSIDGRNGFGRGEGFWIDSTYSFQIEDLHTVSGPELVGRINAASLNSGNLSVSNFTANDAALGLWFNYGSGNTLLNNLHVANFKAVTQAVGATHFRQTTVTGAHSLGATTLNLGSTTGMTTASYLSLGGSQYVRVLSVVNGTQVTCDPLDVALSGGETVVDANIGLIASANVANLGLYEPHFEAVGVGAYLSGCRVVSLQNVISGNSLYRTVLCDNGAEQVTIDGVRYNSDDSNLVVLRAEGTGTRAIRMNRLRGESGGLGGTASLLSLGTGVGPVGVGEKLGEFNVVAFGAVGDGTTDDSAAFRLAAAAIPTSGGTLFIPPGGAFALGSAVDLPNDRPIAVVGADGFPNGGAGSTGCSTIIRRTGYTTGPLLRQTGPASPTMGARIEKVCFNGNGLAGDLLELNGTNQATLHRVGFWNGSGHGLYAPQMWNASLVDCRFFQVGNAASDKWAVYFGSNANGITNTVDLIACQWEALTGGALWAGDNASLGQRSSLIRVLGGKIEQSSNAYSTPFIRLSKASDVAIRGVQCVNGKGAVHIEVTDANRVTLDTEHTTNSTLDADNPLYFVDVQASNAIRIAGSYFRGGSSTGGAQVHIANTVTGWTLAAQNSHTGQLAGACHVLYGSGTKLFRADRGPSGYYVTTAALGGASTLLVPLNGVDINYVANGNTGAIMGVGLDGQSVTVVNEGGTAITFNATDDTAKVYNASGAAVAAHTGARFVWDSRLGSSGLWMRLA